MLRFGETKVSKKNFYAGKNLWNLIIYLSQN